MFASKHAAWVCVYALAATVSFAVVAAAGEEDRPLPLCSSAGTADVQHPAAPAVVIVQVPGDHDAPTAGREAQWRVVTLDCDPQLDVEALEGAVHQLGGGFQL